MEVDLDYLHGFHKDIHDDDNNDKDDNNNNNNMMTTTKRTRVNQLWDLIEACGFCKDINNNENDDNDDDNNYDKNKNNNDQGISVLGLGRDLGFSLGYQGH